MPFTPWRPFESIFGEKKNHHYEHFLFFPEYFSCSCYSFFSASEPSNEGFQKHIHLDSSILSTTNIYGQFHAHMLEVFLKI